MAVSIKWLPSTATSTADAGLATLDYGTIVRPGSGTVKFKIGNTGDATAEQVQVSASVYGSDTEAVNWKSFSIATHNSGAFAATINVPNIAAGNLSGEITGKTTIPSTATLGAHTTYTRVDYVYS